MLSSICNIDGSQAAAWVQAIGSIAAIAAAIWIGERSSELNRKVVIDERKRQADIIASSMAMKFFLLDIELGKKHGFIRQIIKNELEGNQGFPRPTDLESLFLISKSETYSTLRESSISFDRDTGILVNTTIDTIESFNPSVSSSLIMLKFLGNNSDEFLRVSSETLNKIEHLKYLVGATTQRLETEHNLNPASEP